MQVDLGGDEALGPAAGDVPVHQVGLEVGEAERPGAGRGLGGGGDLAAALAALQAELVRHAHELPDHDEVVASVETVQEELARERPDRVTVRGALSGLASAVQSVAGLAKAVEELRRLLP